MSYNPPKIQTILIDQFLEEEQKVLSSILRKKDALGFDYHLDKNMVLFSYIYFLIGGLLFCFLPFQEKQSSSVLILTSILSLLFGSIFLHYSSFLAKKKLNDLEKLKEHLFYNNKKAS